MSITINGTTGISGVDGSAGTPALQGSDPNTGIYSPGANQVAVATNGTGRLFVSDNGVATGGAPQSGYGALQVRNSFIYLNEDGADTTQMYLRTASNEAAIQVATNHPFKIQTNNTERLRITTDAYVRLAAGTGGIQFNGDTAAANALDDYEEGTWTPSIDIGGLTTGITYSQQNGIYTKIGDVVTAGCRILLSNKGTATGSVRIDGLPFAANIPVGPANAGVLVNESNNTNWPQSTSYGLVWNDGYVYLRWNSATVWAPITDSNLTNISQFYWSSTFKVS